jgi:hypothetical protein
VTQDRIERFDRHPELVPAEPPSAPVPGGGIILTVYDLRGDWEKTGPGFYMRGDGRGWFRWEARP